MKIRITTGDGRVFTDDIDPMLFMQTTVDAEFSVIADAEVFRAMPGGEDLYGGVVAIAREKIAEAQATLDAMIEADETWKPVKAEVFHWGHLLSGTITCDCGWESKHYVFAADAEADFAAHLDDMGVPHKRAES